MQGLPSPAVHRCIPDLTIDWSCGDLNNELCMGWPQTESSRMGRGGPTIHAACYMLQWSATREYHLHLADNECSLFVRFQYAPNMLLLLLRSWTMIARPHQTYLENHGPTTPQRPVSDACTCAYCSSSWASIVTRNTNDGPSPACSRDPAPIDLLQRRPTELPRHIARYVSASGFDVD